ncbi:MAG: hypothetical protein ACP5OJ_03710 [Methanothermobacter sp.]
MGMIRDTLEILEFIFMVLLLIWEFRKVVSMFRGLMVKTLPI